MYLESRWITEKQPGLKRITEAPHLHPRHVILLFAFSWSLQHPKSCWIYLPVRTINTDGSEPGVTAFTSWILAEPARPSATPRRDSEPGLFGVDQHGAAEPGRLRHHPQLDHQSSTFRTKLGLFHRTKQVWQPRNAGQSHGVEVMWNYGERQGRNSRRVPLFVPEWTLGWRVEMCFIEMKLWPPNMYFSGRFLFYAYIIV